MMIKLEKDSELPIYRQIANSITKDIEAGILPQGAALPPIRKLADSLSVGRETVVRAYKHLESKRLVYTIGGSGTYVAEIVHRENELFKKFSDPAEEKRPAVDIDFTSSNISKELFPLKEFKKAVDNVLDKGGADIFGYEDPRGIYGLRRLIADKHGRPADRIQIISGAQQGLDIIAKAVLSYGDYVFTEKPTYTGAAEAFALRGANVIGVELKSDGIDIEKLEKLIKLYKPKLVYVMTYFQTPTTVSYSIEKKRSLLDLSYKYDFYIIEEDNLGDFNYSEKELLSLKALDYKNRVIYIKSFSKILMPGLRLGYMIMPKAISEAVLLAKYSADMGTSGFIQYAFESYLKSGGLKRHTAKTRKYYAEKYKLAKELIKSGIGKYVYMSEPKGGLHFWLRLKEGNASELAKRLLARGILIDEGKNYAFNEDDASSFRISFADISDNKFSEGIEKIKYSLQNLKE